MRMSGRSASSGGAMLALRGLYPEPEKWNAAVMPGISALFEEYQEDISLEHMGFPDDWEDRLRINREETDAECELSEQENTETGGI